MRNPPVDDLSARFAQEASVQHTICSPAAPSCEGMVIGCFFAGLGIAFLLLRWSGAQSAIGVVEPLLTGRAVASEAAVVEVKLVEDE